MVFWRNPVGIQSGPSRDPVGTQSGTNFSIFGHRFWPVGIQSGTNFRIFGTTFGPVGKQPNHPKTRKNPAKMLFFMRLAASRHWCPTGSRLDPDQKRCPKMQKLVPDWVPTGSRRDPDWSIDRQEHTPAPIFPFPDPPLPLFSFSAHQPCTNTPPSCTKTAKAVLSQTGVLHLCAYNLGQYHCSYLTTGNSIQHGISRPRNRDQD